MSSIINVVLCLEIAVWWISVLGRLYCDGKESSFEMGRQDHRCGGARLMTQL